MNHGEQSIGNLWEQTRLRVKEATHAIHEEADRLDQTQEKHAKQPHKAKTPHTHQPGQAASRTDQSEQGTTNRAEELVDHMGQRLSSFAAITSLGVQRAVARMREDAEDIWVEAQSIRHKHNSASPR